MSGFPGSRAFKFIAVLMVVIMACLVGGCSRGPDCPKGQTEQYAGVHLLFTGKTLIPIPYYECQPAK